MRLSDRIAFRLHIEAVWDVHLPAIEQDDIELLPTSRLTPWRLCIANLTDSRVRIWRPDVPLRERAALQEQLIRALAIPVPPPEVQREVALNLTAEPTFKDKDARQWTRQLTLNDRAVVEAFDPSFVTDLLNSACHPCIGVIVQGRLLSLAHSSRRTGESCELGIDTLPEARRRGYALAATVAWSTAILREGLTPLYSANAENTPSLRLATAAGYRAFAHAATLM